MAKIDLPNAEEGNAAGKEKDANQQVPADSIVANKLDSLIEMMGADNKARREVDAAKKAQAEEDAKAQLASEADISALLGTSEDDGVDEKARNTKINDMDNSDLLDVIATAVDTAIGARITQASKDVDKKLKTTTDALGGLVKILSKMQAFAGMDMLKGKYQDFDDFKEDTLKVLKKYPMIDIEDAHLLARQIRQGDMPPQSETASERPENAQIESIMSGQRVVDKNENRDEGPKSGNTQGIVGFRDIMKNALDKRFGR